MNYPNVAETECAPNWSHFYRALIRLGPIVLKQIPGDWIRSLQQEGAASDWLWSEDIEESLFNLWGELPELAVKEAIVRYVESVQTALVEFPYTANGPGWITNPSTGELMPRSECVARINCDPVRPRILRALIATVR